MKRALCDYDSTEQQQWHDELPLDVWRELLAHVNDLETLQCMLGVSRGVCAAALPRCRQMLDEAVLKLTVPGRADSVALKRLCSNLGPDTTAFFRSTRDAMRSALLWADTAEQMAQALSVVTLAEQEHGDDGCDSYNADYETRAVLMDQQPLWQLWYDDPVTDCVVPLWRLASLRVVSRMGTQTTWSHWVSQACYESPQWSHTLALLQVQGTRPEFVDGILRALGGALQPLAPRRDDEWGDCCIRIEGEWVSVLGSRAQSFRRRVIVSHIDAAAMGEPVPRHILQKARRQRYRTRNLARVSDWLKPYREPAPTDAMTCT